MHLRDDVRHRALGVVLLVISTVLPALAGVGVPGAEGADGSFGGGAGTSTDPYVIEDVRDLQNMSADLDAYYVLGGDVDASDTASWDSGAGFVPVGTSTDPFTGSLDGRGYAIAGLHIDRPTTSPAGLFGCVGVGGSVKDVALVSANVSGNVYVGALVGYNFGAIYGCSASAKVIGYREVGGLVGWNNDEGTVSGCSMAGNVSSFDDHAGGLVGYARGALSDCRAAVNVEGGGDYAGGLVGYLWFGTVTGSHATGDVSGDVHVGGLAGGLWHCALSGSSAIGRVSGLMGVGGFAGTVFFSTVSGCFAAGDVSGNGNDVGGLVGANGAADPADESLISDCYATGDVSNTDTIVGGLVGMNRATVVDSYSTGSVPRTGGSGGLVGINFGGTVEDGFWDNTTSGMDTSEGGEGRTTAEMKAAGTFVDAGWDLAEVWFIVDGVTYPCLRWQDAMPPTADAGPDQVVDLDAAGSAPVELDGTASSDDFGYLEHAWGFVHDGSPVVLHGATAGFTFESPGVYAVTLTVTDATGHEDTDSTAVTVRDVTPPVADAGPDQAVDEDTPVTFDGGGSSDNVAVAGYAWAFEVGGVPTVLNGVAPTHTFDQPGVYSVKLTVSDAAGHSHEDTMTVTVRDTTPPASDAGPDRSVPVGSNVTLDASASSDNVGVDEYSWAIAYEGTVRTLEGEAVQFTFGVAGTYEVVLSVSDLAGNTDEDTVVITVVDTGTVRGTVVDKGGKPVEGATVEVTASDGGVHTATTGADGSFELEVHHGAFAWKVSKKGYKAVSGESSVDPMGEVELDLTGRPLVKEEASSGFGAVAVLAAIAAVAALSRRRRG